MSNSRQFSGLQGQTRALLSIKPQFISAILSGEKKYEFRRSIFSRKVDVVVVYATAPVKKVVCEFDVESIISAPLPLLWKRTRKHAGVEEDFFFDYFDGRDCGHAIVIGDVRHYPEPYTPIGELGLRPPQSFVYLDD